MAVTMELLLSTLYVVYTISSQWVQKFRLDTQQVYNQFGCDSAAVYNPLVPVFSETSVVICRRQVDSWLLVCE